MVGENGDKAEVVEEKEETVEIADVPEVKEEAFSEDGLTEGEKALAKEHGFIKKESNQSDGSESSEKDDKHKEQPKPETEDSKEDEKQDDKPKTFEEVEKDEGKLKKFNPNEQALYWKYKSDKRKRQKAIQDYEELKAQAELESVKFSSRGNKLKKIQEALKGEDVTIEALQSIIGLEAEEKDNTPITRADLEKIESEKAQNKKQIQEANKAHAERLATAEEIGKTKYKNFDQLTTLAQEVVDSDKTGTYRSVLDAAFSDIEIDEENLIERVVTIAKLNPNFGKEKSEEPESKKETNVDRAIKNSKKKVSSASLGSSGGKRVISHDDLTPDDAEQLTTKDWQKLPDHVRERLLKEA